MNEEELPTTKKGVIFIGFILALTYLSPISLISYKLSNILFFSSFGTNAIIYHLLSFVLKIIISTAIVWFLFFKIDVFKRLSSKYSSFYFLIFGSVFYLLINLMTIFSLIPLPQISTAMASYISMIGITSLYIGCARVLIGIHPE